MTRIKQAAIEHELKRFMRPDAHRFIRPDWRRFVKPNSALERLYGRYERKFSPDRPRVPAGSSEGGQWTSEGGAGSSVGRGPTPSAKNPRTQTASRISLEREEECEMIRRKDEFICKAFRLRACYEQAMLRYANCLQGLPLPPLNF